MKKVLSILLALIIALSAFSMAAFAADAPKTKTEALLDKLYTATELQVSFTPDKKFASDLPMSAITVYAKGNDIAVDTKLGFLPVRAVKTGDACYAYSPLLPFAYLSIDSKVIDGIIGDKDYKFRVAAVVYNSSTRKYDAGKASSPVTARCASQEKAPTIR